MRERSPLDQNAAVAEGGVAQTTVFSAPKKVGFGVEKPTQNQEMKYTWVLTHFSCPGLPGRRRGNHLELAKLENNNVSLSQSSGLRAPLKTVFCGPLT